MTCRRRNPFPWMIPLIDFQHRAFYLEKNIQIATEIDPVGCNYVYLCNNDKRKRGYHLQSERVYKGFQEEHLGAAGGRKGKGENMGKNRCGCLLSYKFHTHTQRLKWSYTSQGLTLYWLLQIVSASVQEMVSFCGLVHLILVLMLRFLGHIQQQQQHILLWSLSLTSLLVSFSRCCFQVWGFHWGKLNSLGILTWTLCHRCLFFLWIVWKSQENDKNA